MKLGDVTERVRDVLDRDGTPAEGGEASGGGDAMEGGGASGGGDAMEGGGASGGGNAAKGGEASEDGERGVRERLPSVTRRRLLGGVVGVGAAKAADNVLIGYGVLTGTNLQRQDLGPLATERLGVSPFETTVADASISLSDGVLSVNGEGGKDGRGGRDGTGDEGGEGSRREYAVGSLAPEEARAADREHGLAAGDGRGPIEELAADWDVITADPPAVEVRPSKTAAFFETVANADARPYTVQALRGSEYDPASPETVATVADADPADPGGVVHGLMHAFNRRTSYDVHRYAAGSVQDNVLMGHVELRDHFETPTTFEALQRGENDGMFCYEFVFRSIDALHAVAPHRQTHPVVAGVVTDSRHKHVYTAIASVVREDGDLVLPMTFVDYTHSTLYDDYAADVVLGDGLEAYDTRHRATEMYWNGYVGGL